MKSIEILADKNITWVQEEILRHFRVSRMAASVARDKISEEKSQEVAIEWFQSQILDVLRISYSFHNSYRSASIPLQRP